MPANIVVGSQWGDEGKGKIIDIMASRADVVVRATGGNNAGHTVVNNGEVYKLHLIPSGILYPETLCLIGAGVVLDPKDFISELDGSGKPWDFHRKPEDRPSCSCGYAVAYRTGRSVGEFPWQL